MLLQLQRTKDGVLSPQWAREMTVTRLFFFLTGAPGPLGAPDSRGSRDVAPGDGRSSRGGGFGDRGGDGRASGGIGGRFGGRNGCYSGFGDDGRSAWARPIRERRRQRR
jgi:hypothetical protein